MDPMGEAHKSQLQTSNFMERMRYQRKHDLPFAELV